MQTLEKASGGTDHLGAQQAAPRNSEAAPLTPEQWAFTGAWKQQTRNCIRPALAEQDLKLAASGFPEAVCCTQPGASTAPPRL